MFGDSPMTRREVAGAAALGAMALAALSEMAEANGGSWTNHTGWTNRGWGGGWINHR